MSFNNYLKYCSFAIACITTYPLSLQKGKKNTEKESVCNFSLKFFSIATPKIETRRTNITLEGSSPYRFSQFSCVELKMCATRPYLWIIFRIMALNEHQKYLYSMSETFCYHFHNFSHLEIRNFTNLFSLFKSPVYLIRKNYLSQNNYVPQIFLLATKQYFFNSMCFLPVKLPQFFRDICLQSI